MYHIFYMDRGQAMVFDLNVSLKTWLSTHEIVNLQAETTTFNVLQDMVSKEVGHRISDLVCVLSFIEVKTCNGFADFS